MNAVSWCPQASATPLILVTGSQGLLKFHKLSRDKTDSFIDAYITGFKREQYNYLCHCWIDDANLVVGTDAGLILWFDSGEYKGVLQSSPANQQTRTQLTAIAPYQKGTSAPSSFIPRSLLSLSQFLVHILRLTYDSFPFVCRLLCGSLCLCSSLQESKSRIDSFRVIRRH